MAGENYSIPGDIRSIRESAATIAAASGGGGGGDASAANQTTEIARLTSILAKIIAAPSTEAKQDTQITAEQAILAKLTADPATQTTLAAVLAKIIAAPATEAKQDTGNTALSAISGKLPAALGSAAAASSLAVAASTEDVARQGIITETAPATDTASSGQNGRLQRIAQRLTSLIALLPTALGSATQSGGLLVTQSTEEIARQGIVTETAPASDTASSGTNGRLQRIAQRLTSLIALLPTALGSAAAASSLAVTQSTEDIARQGIITETAPASDTASSGQNGRLQRIAQRLTSLIALLPASLGAKAHGSSLSVASAGLEYEAVAASQTDIALGATGATGDFLSHIVIQPTTTAAGTVTIKDNTTVIFTFTTGTLADLRPIIVPFNAFSTAGAWKVTTGANVAVIGFGDFT